MNNKKFAVILLIAFAVGIVAAQVIYNNYVLPMTGIIEEEGEVTLAIYTGIEETLWNEVNPIDWGALTIGENTLLLKVENTGTHPAIVTFVPIGLEPGWTLTWAQSGTELAKGATISADMILTIPDGTVATTYSWDVSITTSAPTT